MVDESVLLSDSLELKDSVTSVDASGVGSLILSGCKDSSVGVWDLRTRKLVKRLYHLS